MATLTRSHSLAKVAAVFCNATTVTYKQVLPLVIVRHKQSMTKPAAKFQVESEKISLKTRGFLRPLKPYEPPADVSERLDKILEKNGLPTSDFSTPINDLKKRFELFASCLEEFKYPIPNSDLCHIRTVGDLRNFYRTPIDTTVPYDALAARDDLPQNLHVQKEYLRFHPDTDTMFGGKTAFPETTNFVTGLKSRKKYQGHKQYPKSYYAE